jgi:hypothetical protein
MKRMGARLGAIALVAVLARAVVPAGYMLAHAETREGRYLTIEMCEGHARPQIMDLDTGRLVDLSKGPAGAAGEGSDGGNEGKTAPCVFASAAQLAPPLLIAETVDFAVSYDPGFVVRHDVRPGRGIAAPPPPATGPPPAI